MSVMSSKDSSQKKKEAQANASWAGAGGGTLVAVVANQLPDQNIAKPTLLYLSPSISILVTAFWVWLQVKVANYVRDKEVEQLIQGAKAELEESIANPHISEEHRSYLRKQLEDLDSININRIKSKIKALNVITGDDVRRNLKVKGNDNLEKVIDRSDA